LANNNWQIIINQGVETHPHKTLNQMKTVIENSLLLSNNDDADYDMFLEFNQLIQELNQGILPTQERYARLFIYRGSKHIAVHCYNCGSVDAKRVLLIENI